MSRRRLALDITALLLVAMVAGCSASSPKPARVLPISPAPASPTRGPTDVDGDALTRRTLTELDGFTTWLADNEADGFMGEVGWPAGGRWNRLAERWYAAADTAGLSVSAWAAGAHWGDYPLAIYDSGGADGPINTAHVQSTVLEAHLGRGKSYRRGIAVAGGAFGDEAPGFSNRRPGRHGHDYWYPTAADLRYLADRGFDFVRVDFRWERLQPRLGGPLDQQELRLLESVVAAARTAGLEVVLDLHNYGAYRRGRPGRRPQVLRIGDRQLPASRLVDLWMRLSKNFGNDPGVLAYGLMNEPHDLPTRPDRPRTLTGWDRSRGSWRGPASHVAEGGRGGSGGLEVLIGGKGRSSAFVSNGVEQVRSCARRGSLFSVWARLDPDARRGAWTASLQVQDVTYAYRAGPHVLLEPGRWTQILFSAPTSVLGGCRALAVHIAGPSDAGLTSVVLDDLGQRGRLLPAQVWEAASQSVVAALRERGDDTRVMVSGHNWSKVQTWTAQHPRAWIVDPADAVSYEAHHYWNADQDSQYRTYAEELRRAQR